jgi:zinc protease
MFAGQIAGQPGAVFSREAQSLSVGNDPRFVQLPTDSDLANVQPTDLSGLLAKPLASQADLVMVGDVTVPQAIKAVQATFGSGPAGPKPAAVDPHITMAPARAEPYVAEHSGRADQAFYGEYFPLPDYFTDPKVDAVADVASAIISTRLIDTVREKLGITYSPQVQATSSDELPGVGYLAVVLETPPANFDKFHGLLADQLRDLASKPVSEDELVRARQPLIETERKQRETNGFWMWKLAGTLREPRIETETLTRIDRLSAVTSADVQALIAKYTIGKQPLVVIAKAKASAPPAAAAH